MNRSEVIERLKSVEPDLRAYGIGALYLFGSHAHDTAEPQSDVDVFVDPAGDEFYGLANYIGAYDRIRSVFLHAAIGYSTRSGLDQYIRSKVEAEAVRVF